MNEFQYQLPLRNENGGMISDFVMGPHKIDSLMV